MRKGYFSIGLFSSLLLFSSVVAADSMRCGNKVVKSGDTTVRVLLYCGEPSHREVLAFDEQEHTHTLDNHQLQSSQVTRTERWTYNMGKGKLLKLLTIRKGRLESIDNGERI